MSACCRTRLDYLVDYRGMKFLDSIRNTLLYVNFFFPFPLGLHDISWYWYPPGPSLLSARLLCGLIVFCLQKVKVGS